MKSQQWGTSNNTHSSLMEEKRGVMPDQSPRSPPAAAAAVVKGGVDSPQSRRASLSSAWTSVVRGDSEHIIDPSAAATNTSSPQALGFDDVVEESLGSEAQPDGANVNGEGNAGVPRIPVWNKPVNGVVEVAPVMGGDVSWPALSESTRPVPRSSAVPPRVGSNGPASSSQAPIISQPTRRQANTNAHTNSTSNSTTPTRPRSRNRGGGGGGPISPGIGPPQNFNWQSPPPPPPLPPPFPIFGLPSEIIPAMVNTSIRSTRPVAGDESSESIMGNGHSSPRNTSRRSNYGPRPSGDGPYHSNHGGQRDHDRRDIRLSPQFGPPPPIGYMPPPLHPGASPFIAPPPMRIFPGQMGFDMASPFIYVPTLHSESFGALPMVHPPPPPPIPFPLETESPLSNMIVSQIEYYFSDVNLVTDKFLRSYMDGHGWVHITLIASFPRVQQLTRDIPLILESLKHSTIVEVQGDRLRKRHEWNKWLNSSNGLNADSSSQTSNAVSANDLVTSFHEVSLTDAMASAANDNIGTGEGHMGMATGVLLSEELAGQSRVGYGDDAVEEVRSIIV